jgi:DNA-binding PadR family transcriptional regulator
MNVLDTGPLPVYYVATRYSVRRYRLAKDKPKAWLPLTPAMFHILLALADKERHGYDIMREVDERSEGQMRLGPGTLYGSIKRMLRDGLIEELDERPAPELDDERRRYYRLSKLGYRVIVAEAERLEKLVKSARSKKVLATRSA